MIETYYVGAYWKGRQEPAAACARRAEAFLRLLVPLDSTWVHWFGKADTLEEALKRRIDPVAATFEALFTQKDHRLPIDGYMLGLWNGDPSLAATTLEFTCGTSSRFVSNVCLLELPAPASSPVGDRIVTSALLTQLLKAMALTWEPDWGVVMSEAYRDQTWPDKQPPVHVGWVTYLSRRRGTVPPLPAPVRVEPVEHLGTLMTLTPERFTVDNPAHVELAHDVRQILDQAGLLGPEQVTASD
jgi:hypothetical protein